MYGAGANVPVVKASETVAKGLSKGAVYLYFPSKELWKTAST
jgi:AcrR family transcriptional regulator